MHGIFSLASYTLPLAKYFSILKFSENDLKEKTLNNRFLFVFFPRSANSLVAFVF